MIASLRGVLDLSSSRVLWVRPVGVCFVATAVYGEGAVELDTFRRFRDVALLPNAPGRLLVAGYYRVGPPRLVGPVVLVFWQP